MLFFILSIANCNLIFIKQFKDQQGIKRLDQIKKDYEEVHLAFTDNKTKVENIISETSNYDVFKFYNEKELVVSVYLWKKIYVSIIPSFLSFLKPSIKKEYGIEIYSLYVNDKYRNKGYARLLIYKSLIEMKNHYNLDSNYIVGLHLNESDKFMNISFFLYYSMNFRRGTFVENGPSCYSTNFEDFYDFKNPVDIINNPSICKDKGNYFAMYARYYEILPFRILKNKKLLETGQKLRRELKFRKNKYL